MKTVTERRRKFISNALKVKEDKKESIKKTKKKKTSKKNSRGVVYFSHIPHGFYEEQIKEYCSQFGKVTGIYLPKSKRNNYRGYGFVEFLHPEVAEVVAETMNNYLMFNRLVKGAKYIPPAEQRPGVIRRAKKWDNHVRAIEENKKTIHLMTRTLNSEEEEKQKRKYIKSVDKYHERLKKLNCDYEFKVEN